MENNKVNENKVRNAKINEKNNVFDNTQRQNEVSMD